MSTSESFAYIIKALQAVVFKSCNCCSVMCLPLGSIVGKDVGEITLSTTSDRFHSKILPAFLVSRHELDDIQERKCFVTSNNNRWFSSSTCNRSPATRSFKGVVPPGEPSPPPIVVLSSCV
ncbi:uncharacterized protein [Physcomitrium patens]|uniref:uncharacterized protein n=1 Tax=Physcomitrium patens TaxID=3218 RepID=UPI003CCD7744